MGENVLNTLLNLILNPFFIRALVGLILVAIASSCIGPILNSRGMAFLTAEVAHATLGGAALGILLHEYISTIDPLIIALLFGVLSGLLAGYAGKTGIPEELETAIGVTLAFAMSIAVLLLAIIPSEDIPLVWGYLLGDILLLSDSDLIILSVIVVITVVIYLLFYREFIYIAFDIDGAEALGLNTRLYHYLSIFISSLAIVAATKAIGSIMVYAFMIAPPSIALVFCRRISTSTIISFIIIMVTGLIGLTSSFVINIAPSGLIGILICILYLISVTFRHR